MSKSFFFKNSSTTPLGREYCFHRVSIIWSTGTCTNPFRFRFFAADKKVQVGPQRQNLLASSAIQTSSSLTSSSLLGACSVSQPKAASSASLCTRASQIVKTPSRHSALLSACCEYLRCCYEHGSPASAAACSTPLQSFLRKLRTRLTPMQQSC